MMTDIADAMVPMTLMTCSFVSFSVSRDMLVFLFPDMTTFFPSSYQKVSADNTKINYHKASCIQVVAPKKKECRALLFLI